MLRWKTLDLAGQVMLALLCLAVFWLETDLLYPLWLLGGWQLISAVLHMALLPAGLKITSSRSAYSILVLAGLLILALGYWLNNATVYLLFILLIAVYGLSLLTYLVLSVLEWVNWQKRSRQDGGS